MSQEKIWWIAQEKLYQFDGEVAQDAPLKRLKKAFVGSTIDLSLLRTYTFKLPLATEEEKLTTLVEIKMFEEGGLDTQKEYAITYLKHRLSFDDSWLIEAFAVEEEQLHTTFDALVKKIGHIDLLALPYAVYGGLYAFEYHNKNATELFIHLSADGGFAVLYKEGQPVAHRTLSDFSSVALKAKVDTKVIFETLTQKGLVREQYGLDESLIFAAIEEEMVGAVNKIAQTINHKRGIFGIEGVDTVYLDCSEGEIPGFWELLNGYGFQESRKKLLRCCKSEGDKRHLAVEALYGMAVAQGRIDGAPNFTIFEPKPTFWTTQTGRLLLALAAGGAVSVGLGGYLAWEQGVLQKKHQALQRQYHQISKRNAALKKRADALEEVRKKWEAKVEGVRRKIAAYEEATNFFAEVRTKKQQRRKTFEEINKLMARHKLLALSIEQNATHLVHIKTLAPFAKREEIASFMYDLAALGYRTVRTREVRLDRNATLYESLIEVAR